MMTDPIADMLTRIRNSASAHREEVEIPYSKVKYTIAKIMEKCGYLGGVETKDDTHMLVAKLRYDGRASAFEAIRRISKPGRRVYKKADELSVVRSGNGLAIVS